MTRCENHSCCYRRRWQASITAAGVDQNHSMAFSTAVVWAFLLALSGSVLAEQHHNAPLADTAIYMPELEEQVDLAEVLDQGEQELDESENEAAKLQKLASLLSVLRSTLNERQQGGQAATEDDEQLSGVYPALLPLLKDEDKRGSYMSLCHFKICNMGRKRNLRWSPFVRM